MYQLLQHKYVLLTLSCSIEEPISGILCEILLTFFVGQICCFSQIDILKVGRTRTLDFNLVEGPLKKVHLHTPLYSRGEILLQWVGRFGSVL